MKKRILNKKALKLASDMVDKAIYGITVEERARGILGLATAFNQNQHKTVSMCILVKGFAGIEIAAQSGIRNKFIKTFRKELDKSAGKTHFDFPKSNALLESRKPDFSKKILALEVGSKEYEDLLYDFNYEMRKAVQHGRICTPQRMAELYPIFKKINKEIGEGEADEAGQSRAEETSLDLSEIEMPAEDSCIDLAKSLSQVLSNPQCPEKLYNAIQDEIGALPQPVDNSAEYLARALCMGDVSE